MGSEDYNPHTSPVEITKLIAGKVVRECVSRDGMNGLFVIIFEDGTELEIEYDWLYGWEFKKANERNQSRVRY